MAQWLVLLPPLIILFAAFLTHNIILSIFLGISSAALIAANFAPIPALGIAANYFTQKLFVSDNINLYGFLIILGTIITLISHTGGVCQFSNFLIKRLKTAVGAETAPLVIAMFLGVDDYLSSLTNSCIMKPLTDALRIARVKLAFLADVMASPLVILVPISSWVALIVSQLKLAGVNMSAQATVQAEPFYLYLESIPFICYSFIVIGSAWFIVRTRISYGTMAKQERIAQQTGNLFGGKEPRFKADAQPRQFSGQTYLSDFIVPITSLILFTLIGIPWCGGYTLFGGQHGFLEACRDTDIFAVLMYSSCASLFISTILAWYHATIKLNALPGLFTSGLGLMYNSIIIVFCASVFSLMLKDLHTGHYLATLVLPHVHIVLLPLITFVMTILIAMGIGSSWGTISVTVPIIVPIMCACAQAAGIDVRHVLPAAIGAILSGAVAGAQLSPISDPVTMASTGAGCYQIDHAQTQFWYLLPIITGSCCAFVASGLSPLTGALNGLISSAIGLVAATSLLWIINVVSRRRRR